MTVQTRANIKTRRTGREREKRRRGAEKVIGTYAREDAYIETSERLAHVWIYTYIYMYIV